MIRLIIALGVFAWTIGVSQAERNETLIQNFYETCKAKTYPAFLAVNKGVELLDTRQYDRALSNFKKALEKDSTCCDAWYLIAFCDQQKGEYERAIQSCNRALRINPDNPSALVIKANSLLLLKRDSATSMALFQKVIALVPDKIDGYYGLALTYHTMGNNELARQAINAMEEKGAKTVNLAQNKKIRKLKELTR